MGVDKIPCWGNQDADLFNASTVVSSQVPAARQSLSAQGCGRLTQGGPKNITKLGCALCPRIQAPRARCPTSLTFAPLSVGLTLKRNRLSCCRLQFEAYSFALYSRGSQFLDSEMAFWLVDFKFSLRPSPLTFFWRPVYTHAFRCILSSVISLVQLPAGYQLPSSKRIGWPVRRK